jgi:chromosomal replication initiator protein
MVESSASDPAVLWQRFLDTLKPKISGHVIKTWFKPVRLVGISRGIVTLQVRDQFFKDWLTDHYLDLLKTGLSQVTGEPVFIDWELNPSLTSENKEEDPSTSPVSSEAPLEKKPLGDMPVSAPSQISMVRESLEDGALHTRQLNKRYLFANFVCGPSNDFAFAACKAVADNPGVHYNPLFIFGGVGLGKTHLLSAIGHHVLESKPEAKIIYTSSEQFTNEVINAVLGGKLDEFRSKYRNLCDVLLIDDIQLIAGKERTQHEFFHIFNTLYDSQRQIVVTSDKLPHEIPDIEERLRSRFQWSLIADIQPPEIETRVAILRKKAACEGVALDDDVAFFLAKNIRSNVRELEGALVRIMAHSTVSGAPLTVDHARKSLAELLSTKPQDVSIETIQKLVATYFQIRITDLKSHRRLKNLIKPRQVAMYLSRKITGASFPELGSRFGDKDHTTILNAYNKIDEQLKNDPTLRTQILEIENQLDSLENPH